MKYLDMPSLSRLTNMLTDCTLGDQMLNGRIEAFSCKKAGDDKRLSKALQKKFQRKRKRSRGDSVTILTSTSNNLDERIPSSVSSTGAASLAMAGERIPHGSDGGGAQNQKKKN